MFYAICEGDPGSSTSPPFRFYKFKTLEEMKPCGVINEYSIVYNGDAPRQLAEFCSKEELESILRSFGKPAKFVSIEQAADNLHQLTTAKAITWKPEKENDMTNVATVAEPVTPVSAMEAPAPVATQKQSRPRFNKDAKIVCLADEPPIRAGTNRYRNMLVVMQSATVSEAMEKLRALTPAPGGGVDIKIAIKAGAVKLED
jgi:hypothetical protein